MHLPIKNVELYALNAPSLKIKYLRNQVKPQDDVSCTVTTAAENWLNENDSTMKTYWEEHANYPILDAIIVSLSTRFSEERLKIATAVDELFKLNFRQSSFVIDYY